MSASRSSSFGGDPVDVAERGLGELAQRAGSRGYSTPIRYG